MEQITFSGDYANKVHQPVLYITERAVFELRPEGVTLVEIAPGIDLQTQVLDQMEFMPKIADDLKLMDERIVREELMGLANDLTSLYGGDDPPLVPKLIRRITKNGIDDPPRIH